MIDDHNRCEWVNVSFGTGSPGLSGAKGHKMAAAAAAELFNLFHTKLNKS